MKRLRVIFAAVFLLLALPMWRFLDMIAIAAPFDWPLTFAMFIWAGIFIAIPLKLIKEKTKIWVLLLVMLSSGVLTYWSTPLSKMSTDNPDFNHCGQMTYTGMFYPIGPFLTDAYRDDLEARNQMCWVKKMIYRVPESYELGPYIKIVHNKLMKPQIKYSSTLPLIAWLMGKINLGSQEANAPLNIYDSVKFWREQYTEEISSRNYPVWNWPHSDYIKFEYGLIERNWQKFIEGLVLETN